VSLNKNILQLFQRGETVMVSPLSFMLSKNAKVKMIGTRMQNNKNLIINITKP